MDDDVDCVRAMNELMQGQLHWYLIEYHGETS